MKNTRKRQSVLPHFLDMNFLVRTACEMYQIAPINRPRYVLTRLAEHLGARAAVARVIDETGHAVAACAATLTGATPEFQEREVAGEMISRWPGAGVPVVRQRRDFITDVSDINAETRRMINSAETIYSLHAIDPSSRCLIAVYPIRADANWGTRECNVVRLLHSQTAEIFRTVHAKPFQRLSPRPRVEVSPSAWPTPTTATPLPSAAAC